MVHFAATARSLLWHFADLAQCLLLCRLWEVGRRCRLAVSYTILSSPQYWRSPQRLGARRDVEGAEEALLALRYTRLFADQLCESPAGSGLRAACNRKQDGPSATGENVKKLALRAVPSPVSLQ